MIFKRLITIFICMFVMFLGIIPKGSFCVTDHTLQYGIGNTETISKPMAESREDAAVKEVTTITQSLNVVFIGVLMGNTNSFFVTKIRKNYTWNLRTEIIFG